MSDPELEKLLGGFAADTLTADEKQRLYEAALQDQQLFNTLADEQALKELLSDPAVRRRLLQALDQTSASGAGKWLDWFRRPAGLAWAGGLAAAALALVLGTRIYQDSLKQAAQSVLTEATKPVAPPTAAPPVSQPAPPPVAEPAPNTQENRTPAKNMAKKDALLDKLSKRERVTATAPQEQKASDAVAYVGKDRLDQDEPRRQADAPGKTTEEVASSADLKLATSSAPPASAPAPLRAPAGAAAGGATAPNISARALYHDEASTRPDSALMAQEKERAMKPFAESRPQAGIHERRFERFSQPGRAKGALTSPKPLGLRYRLVSRGTDGRERDLDAATLGKTGVPVHLSIESNQEAYLQVWITVGTAATFLLWPDKDTGQISVRIAAGQRQLVSLPGAGEPLTLTIRLSHVPFGPITRQEVALLDRPAPGQLQEWVPEEQSTYAVLPDPSSHTQLLVTIPLGK